MAGKIRRLGIQSLARRDKGFMSTMVAPPGKTFVSVDLCFPAETEVLTPDGFKSFAVLSEEDLIWQVDHKSLIGNWVKPERILKYDYTGDMIDYVNRYGTFTVTRDHTLLWAGQVNHPTRKDKALKRRISKAGDGSENSGDHFIHFSNAADRPENDITDEQIWLGCALHADSSYDYNRKVYNVQLSRPRKREKFANLIGRPGTEQPMRDCHTMPVEAWVYLKITNPLLLEKSFRLDVLESLTDRQIEIFTEALRFWDGSFIEPHSKRSGRFDWGQTNKIEVEKIQSFLVRRGYGATMKTTVHTNNAWNDFHILSIRKKNVTRLKLKPGKLGDRTTGITKISSRSVENLPVGCVTVPSGFIMVRIDGKPFVSGNCAGEPTVTTHFSSDVFYKYAVFDGVGKTPFYKNHQNMDVLMLSDLYLMVMSVSPIGKHKMREMFNTKFNGVPFTEKWLEDDEFIKKELKKERQISKILSLALSYGMGPKKMVVSAHNAGYILDIKDAKEFYKAYWDLFARIRLLGQALERQVKMNKFLVNPFGYRIVPHEKELYKTLNYFIQSSVSGLMHVLCSKFFAVAPFCDYVSTIHDEVLYAVDTHRLDESKLLMERAVDSLNKDLKWSVAMRTGFAPGDSLYTAK